MGYNITFGTVLLIILLVAGSFSAGVWLADRFNTRAAREQKLALEKQYVRLVSRSDADDPCKPYLPKPVVAPGFDETFPTGPIDQKFMDDLQQNGKAATRFRKPGATES